MVFSKIGKTRPRLDMIMKEKSNFMRLKLIIEIIRNHR